MEIESQLLKQIAKVESQRALTDFNPLGAGGVADYFTVASTTIELAAAIKAAIDLELPYLVLGQGSQVLIADGGFPGLVIHNCSQAFAIAQERSQVVVDSGLPLTRLVTLATTAGLGGLTDLFNRPGSVGGALYRNTYPVLSSALRFLTLIQPPVRLDRQAVIKRYKSDWLWPTPENSRLRQLKEQSPLAPAPIILTVALQLTTVRAGELQKRLSLQNRQNPPSDPRLFGPLFPDQENLETILKQSGTTRLRVGNLRVHPRHPNYLTGQGKRVAASEIRQLIELIQQQVWHFNGLELTSRYEYVGLW